MSRFTALLVGIVLAYATPAVEAKQYALRDLGTLGGSKSVAYGINDSGQIVGSSTDANGVERPFIWDEANGMRTPNGLENISGYATAINNNGQIVCNVSIDGRYHAARWDSATGLQFMNERPGDLFSIAESIDSSGRLVGNTGSSIYITRAVLWSADGAIERDFCSGRGTVINDNGWVGGYSYERRPVWLESMFLWDPENGYRLIDAGRPLAINESNTIAGWATVRNGNCAFEWSPESGILDLGLLYPEMEGSSSGDAINDAGTVVGTVQIDYADLYPFVWDAVDGLEVLGGFQTGIDLIATGIDNSGRIVGYSRSDSGEQHALMWTPVPEPSSMLSVLAGLLFVRCASRRCRKEDHI